MFNIKHIIFLFIRSQMAESGPPLGTVLGNIGINASKFCKDFNDFTKDLPSYFVLKVKILVMEDRTYSFSVDLPSTGYLLSILKKQKIKKIGSGKDIVENYISLRTLVLLAILKFPFLPLSVSINTILGSVKSSKLLIDL
jgi:ribosomal protein L11